jgi:hypothetical protein
MSHYLVALLAIIVLCAGWGIFQLWLSKHDPELAERANKCGNCSCDRKSGDCSNAA